MTIVKSSLKFYQPIQNIVQSDRKWCFQAKYIFYLAFFGTKSISTSNPNKNNNLNGGFF